VSTLDKFEYQVRVEEIKTLIAEGEYAEAVQIADTVDWRRVRSVMMLCTISDLYKINRRYQESKDILLLAYEKHPTGRLIVYSLCELAIKMEEYVQAIEYYKEFVQIAPKDTGRYVLQYRLYEAQDVSMEERIAVLEEFKKREPREKWVYELAYLYHRIGLTTKCVEECDEMFLWFGEGRYVIKALELKALHQPLSEDQQVKYDRWVAGRSAGEEIEDSVEEDDIPEEDMQDTDEIRYEEDEEEEEEVLAAPTTELPEVKTVDVGQYNTINLQMALAESMREVLEEDEDDLGELAQQDFDEPGEEEEFAEEEPAEDNLMEDEETEEEPYDDDDDEGSSITESIIAPLLQETAKLPVMDTGELNKDNEVPQRDDSLFFDAQQIIEQMKKEAERLQQAALRAQAANRQADQIPGAATGVLTPLNAKPTEYDKMLSQEYDGQISLVVPEAEKVEKQITGQLSIDDIMAEWEQVKKTNEEKRMEDVRQHIMAQTGRLFANFDEATKNGLLEELEKAFMAAIMKESGKKPKVKKVILPDDDEEEDEEPAPKKTQERSVDREEPAEPEETEVSEELEETEEPAVETDEEPEERSRVRPSRKPSHRKGKPAEEAEEETGARGRDLTTEEQELFGQFVHHRKSRKQLVNVLDNMSLASCTGNVLISGEEEDMALDLAKALIREMQYNDGNFSGKVAKIEGPVLNKKDVAATFGRLDNGALIIDRPSKLRPETVSKMVKFLEKDNMGLLLLMVDTKQNINELVAKHPAISNNFNLRVDIEPLDNESLVAYAKQYAEEMEYSIDEFGILALHTRIADRQTIDHEVSLAEVRELVDEAISYANKKTPGHFMDVLLAKRYDEEDMIILREKDFMHY
jgi:tetratricopeptide (TPR) repeat protein